MDKKFLRIKVYDIKTPFDEGFNIDAMVEDVFQGALEKKFFGKIEGSPYIVTKEEYKNDLEEWARGVREKRDHAERVLREGTNRNEYTKALMDLNFLNSGSVTECVAEFRVDPHAAIFNYDVEYRKVPIIQDLLIRQWEHIQTAAESENYFWIFDVALKDSGYDHMPVIVTKFSDTTAEDKKLVLEFITLGCGNAIGQRFLEGGETHRRMKDDELNNRMSKSNNIYQDVNFFKENALNWIVQYTKDKLGFMPRFLMSKGQYERIKALS